MAADLRASAGEYLALRRAMGYRLRRHDGLIGQFLDYLEDQQESRISVDQALGWACLPRGAAPRWRSARLAAIRGFAAYVHTHSGEAAELIPAGLLPSRIDHAVPYLYTPAQLTDLINHARTPGSGAAPSSSSASAPA
ncbi:MAG: hypothetical protein LC799_08725, partial [Actinobacteria bacterium]|nr:hypothetical protein [Actinomycetota bacterium]